MQIATAREAIAATSQLRPTRPDIRAALLRLADRQTRAAHDAHPVCPNTLAVKLDAKISTGVAVREAVQPPAIDRLHATHPGYEVLTQAKKSQERLRITRATLPPPRRKHPKIIAHLCTDAGRGKGVNVAISPALARHQKVLPPMVGRP